MFNTQDLTQNQVEKFNKLVSDICYVIRPNGSWYLATSCEDKLLELQRLQRVMSVDKGVKLTNQSINEFLEQGKIKYVKLEQPLETQYRTFFCHVKVPRKYSRLINERVVTISEIKVLFDYILNTAKKGMFSINGVPYSQYKKGLTTSGGIICSDINGELTEVSLLNIDTIKPYVSQKNAEELLTSVCTYKKYNVTLNTEILLNYYGSRYLSELESKGVRYRYCYYDILMNGDSKSDYYYKSKFGIKEDFHGLSELLTIVKSGMSKERKGCVARRLVPINQILTGKVSLYVTIPKDAVLGVVNNPSAFSIYYISNDYGYSRIDVVAVDVATAKAKAKVEFAKLYLKNFEVLSITQGDNILSGYKPLKNMPYQQLYDIYQSVAFSYTEGFDSYRDRLLRLASDNGISCINDLHIKYLFINTLAKKERYSYKVQFVLFLKVLCWFFELAQDELQLDTKLKKCLRPLALAKITADYKDLVTGKKSANNGSSYRSNYGIIPIVDGEPSKMVELYFGDYFIGKTVIS